MAKRRILDVACGSRMFWLDKADRRGVFCDNRRECRELTDRNVKGGLRKLVISPDLVCDFTALPFADATFPMVVFDPPHLVRAGANGWMSGKYGVLAENWREMIRGGFIECFRVLRLEGVLVFKWNEYQIPLVEILALTEEQALFGHPSGKRSKTHWMTFLKS